MQTSLADPWTFGTGYGSGSADPHLWLIDPDPHADPAIFVSDLQDANKKNILLLILFEGTFTSYLKIKRHKEVTKSTVGINVFLLFLLDDRRIRTRISDKWIRMRIREAPKNMDPTDPGSDPQHWCKPVLRIRIHMFLDLLDPDPLVSGMDPALSLSKNSKKTLIYTVLWLIFDFLRLKNDVKVPSQSNMQNFFSFLSFLLASWRAIMKIEGSGSTSGSTPKCHGSATLMHTITLPSPPSFPLLDTVRSVGTELPVVSELFLLAGVGGAEPLLSDEDIV